MARSPQIKATTLLRECVESSVGLALVPPISDRLDSLVALAEASGDRTNRKELLASLILAAPSDGEVLAEVVRRYRRCSVGEARLDRQDADFEVTVTRRRPGPRPRKKHPS